jgi:nitrogen regulatory protein PII
MPNLVVVVLPDFLKCHEVLDLWERHGVSGITVLESVGLHKIRQARDDLPLFPSIRHLVEGEEYHHRTAFTIVDDDFDLDGLIEATEQAIGGDFDVPCTGILFVMPVSHAFGIRSNWNQTGR